MWSNDGTLTTQTNNDSNNDNVKTTMQQMLSKVDNPTLFLFCNKNSNNDNEPSYWDLHPCDRRAAGMLRVKCGERLMNQDEKLQA